MRGKLYQWVLTGHFFAIQWDVYPSNGQKPMKWSWFGVQWGCKPDILKAV
jgi:hypothetical protein